MTNEIIIEIKREYLIAVPKNKKPTNEIRKNTPANINLCCDLRFFMFRVSSKDLKTHRKQTILLTTQP